MQNIDHTAATVARLRERAAHYRALAEREPNDVKGDTYADIAKLLDEEADAVQAGVGRRQQR